jgi:hypothetical protein
MYTSFIAIEKRDTPTEGTMVTEIIPNAVPIGVSGVLRPPQNAGSSRFCDTRQDEKEVTFST